MRCVALFSGGLDSQLAVRFMQRQGIQVHAVTVETTFACGKPQVEQRARELGVPWTVLPVRDDYLDVLRHPWFGYGRAVNPCVDCRIYMCRRARECLQQFDARFVVTGEILGQRPMSQKRRDLDVIAYHSGLHDLLLRPLSARLLPATQPERLGWVRRQQLGRFAGRNRRVLIDLARSLGITHCPSPSTGCPLTEKPFGDKVRDLLKYQPACSHWDFHLLPVGRHFRYDRQTKIVIGRHEADNQRLESMHEQADAQSTARLQPDNFQGPAALIVGPGTEAAVQFAAALVLRFAKARSGRRLHVITAAGRRLLQASPLPAAEQAVPIVRPPAPPRKRRLLTSD